MTSSAILCLNAGSSSIKYALFDAASLHCLSSGQIENVTDEEGHKAALAALLDQLTECTRQHPLAAIGHRVVHGGTLFTDHVLVTEEALVQMTSLIPFAPLHQPHNLRPIALLRKTHPHIPQAACFDTVFHRTQKPLVTHYAIPRKYTEKGIIRYGFHGLSYDYIASQLPHIAGEKADGKIIVMHLGNGASLCAMENRQSIASSMGFSTLEGAMMGTRPGRLDAGVLLYLLEEEKLSLPALNHLLYHECGLKGVSGISHDMRKLLASAAMEAKEAVGLFCNSIVEETGRLVALLEGLDALVFTAGIGEHAAPVRKQICERLAWMGVKLDEEANANHAACISSAESSVAVYVIPTHEEKVMAEQVQRICGI